VVGEVGRGEGAREGEVVGRDDGAGGTDQRRITGGLGAMREV
jgi:hypothetical protein